ncbi:MAG: ABC transporter permease [Peptococcaceae bacterium]|nr:ABC transporter permease [Peptococcaceae bacterium]
MRNIVLLALNTLKVVFRKKGNYIAFFLLPVIGILVSIGSYGHVSSVNLKMGVLNRDNSIIADDMIRSLGREDKFKITPVDEREIENALTTGKIDCVVIIPRDFGDSVRNNQPQQVEVVSIKGKAATAWVSSYLNTYAGNLFAMAEASGGDKDNFSRIYGDFTREKPALKVSQVQDRTRSKGMASLSIGFLVMFIMLGAGNTAEIILKEKRDRTYFRICAAPVDGRSYVAGNVLANLVIITIQILLTLFLLSGVFHINTYVPWPQLFLILSAFGLVAIGLGLLVVAFAGNSMQAQTLQLVIITPTCLLSGCFWPLEIMPGIARRIADFLPQTWAISAIQRLQEGGDFDQVFMHLSILLAFGLAFFLAAAYGFGRNDNIKSFI